jgi:hypothetical protein
MMFRLAVTVELSQPSQKRDRLGHPHDRSNLWVKDEVQKYGVDGRGAGRSTN